MEEVKERLAAVESREAVIVERHKHLRERREVFDDRRFAYRKRRDEMEERRATVAEQSDEDRGATLRAKAALDRDARGRSPGARADGVRARRGARGRSSRATVAEIIGERVETSANDLIVQAVERQDASNVDSAPRISPFSLEGLDELAQERVGSPRSRVIAGRRRGLGVDTEKHQATLRTVDPIEARDREAGGARGGGPAHAGHRGPAAHPEGPPIDPATRPGDRRAGPLADADRGPSGTGRAGGHPPPPLLVRPEHALLHCEETGHLCGVIAAELGLPRKASLGRPGYLHDIGKAVDHDVEGVHAIIGGELLASPRRRRRHCPRSQGAPLRRGAVDRPGHADHLRRRHLRIAARCPARHPGHLPAFFASSSSRPSPRATAASIGPFRYRRAASCARLRQGVRRSRTPTCRRSLAEIAREIESEMQYPGGHQGDGDP